MRRNLLGRVVRRVALQAQRLFPVDHDPQRSYLVSPRLVDRQRSELFATFESFLDEYLRPADLLFRDGDLRAEVDRFFDVYARRPIRQNVGGSSFHNCFWLYMVNRCLQPQLIIESGVYRGQSSWILRQAAPQATLHAFDITLRRLEVDDPTIQYHEQDWADFPLGSVDAKRSVAWFDCHTNQAKRIREAYDRGFRLLLFDDNNPAHVLHTAGAPAAPTVNMLLEPTIGPGETFEWVWRGEPRCYTYTEEDEYGAAKLVASHVVFPDVGRLSGFGNAASFLTFVRLVD